MPQYYLDIETTGFNPKKDKIISIQYVKVWNNGMVIDNEKLVILKEWESSEENIINKFYKVFMTENKWEFIPIMQNHIFDLTFLFEKFKKYGLKTPNLAEFIYDKPLIDIKYMLVMCNGLNFKGSGLDMMTNKATDGREIPQFYTRKKYKEIEKYIVDETKCFLEFFQKCMLKLPKLIKE